MGDSETIEELLQVIECAAMMRGMMLDPLIPGQTKEALEYKATELDSVVKKTLEKIENG